MSVRRLAEPSVQPPTFVFDETFSAQADTWVAKYPESRKQSAVIPLLMLAQEQEGWVTKAAIESIATMLGMPYIRALEVATFYTQFQLKPVGSRAHVQVCGTTPCMIRGSEALMDVCRSKIHHDQFHLNASGTLSWEEVECLGACVNAPMVMIFKDTYEDLTPERLGEIIDLFERGQGTDVPVGPQNGRFVSMPLSGQTTLKDEQALIDAAREAKSRPAPASAALAASAPQTAPAEASVPPSKAAKPATDAPETNGAIESPSPVKADPAAEEGKGSEIAPHDHTAADKAEPAVEGGQKNRERPIRAEEPAPYKAPELVQKPQGGESGRIAQAAEGARDEATVPGSAVGSVSPAASAGVGAALPEHAPAAGSGPTSRLDVSDSNAVPPGQSGLAAEHVPESLVEASEQAVHLVASDHPDRPRGIERPAQPDDIKLISGVGPKTENILHALGIYTFAQIAAWNERERHWVDGYLKFHGRIERDGWVHQAKVLAEGGEAEYERVFGRKPR